MRRFYWAMMVVILLASVKAGGAAEIVWVEAERFERPGGWMLDTQFIDQMGSPYLLAAGMGTPVADAVTRVELKAGRSGQEVAQGRSRQERPTPWRLWVRTKDWETKSHPGRFKILLDGKEIGREFGASGRAGWVWEDGGTHELGGAVTIALRDLTGYYGRCDAIALTTDLNWTPPADKAGLAALRERLGGVSRDVRDAGQWDVVVAGGGLAGCMAAVSAARLGARVALIQDRPVLGGNGSTEILVPPVGVTNASSYRHHPLDPRETGPIEEVREGGFQKTSETRYYSSRLRRLVENEPTLSLFLNTHVTGVVMAGSGRGRPRSRQISAVEAVVTTSGERLRFGGKLFIDCTGDAVVGVAAGAEWRQGREGRAEFGETMAPETANTNTMGNSLKYAATAGAAPQPFTAPAWAMPFPDCVKSFPIGRHPRHPDLEMGWQWMIELGGMGDPYREKEETRDELLRLVYGIWDHVKNHCVELTPKTANHRLAWVETVVGVRESRRLIGDTIFTEHDVGNKILHPDRIAYGAWGLDDHPSEGFFNWERYNNHKYGGVEHSIPYRILYSKNVDNLMMAGRDVSASHVGMGTTRVQITCALMGMAAGTAAGLCIERGSTPRGIYQNHLAALQQQLLKDGAFIIDLPNADPRDLARSARVSASSEATTVTAIKTKEVLAAEKVIDGVARARLDSAHAWEADKQAKGAPWIELAWPEARTFNMVHVTFFRKDVAARRFLVQAGRGGSWTTVAVIDNPGIFRRCLAPIERVSADRLRVVLERPAGICEIRVYDESEGVLETARRAAANMRRPDGPEARLPWE